MHDHVFRLGAAIRSGLAEIFADLGVPAVAHGYGSVFVSYFLAGPAPRTYTDLLRNDASLFIGYRRRLLDHGIFELPLNLKRSHVSYAHTDADVAALLDATRAAVRDTLAEGGERELAGTSTMGGAS